MDKSPDAFRTISEVAEELQIPQHVLRFWESRFAQIKPMKRAGGRRYYRPDDVDLLRGIQHLLYGEGYTIRGVQRILREQGGKFVQAVWQPGAAQPTPSAEDSGDADAPARRPAPPLNVPRDVPPDVADSPVAAGEGIPPRAQRNGTPGSPPGLTPEQRRTLESTVADLEQCRRALVAALDAPDT